MVFRQTPELLIAVSSFGESHRQVLLTALAVAALSAFDGKFQPARFDNLYLNGLQPGCRPFLS